MAIVIKGSPDNYDAANKEMSLIYTKKADPDGEICFLAADPVSTWNIVSRF